MKTENYKITHGASTFRDCFSHDFVVEEVNRTAHSVCVSGWMGYVRWDQRATDGDATGGGICL